MLCQSHRCAVWLLMAVLASLKKITDAAILTVVLSIWTLENKRIDGFFGILLPLFSVSPKNTANFSFNVFFFVVIV